MTPVQRRIMLALDTIGDMDAHDLAEAACCSFKTLTGGQYLKRMVEDGLIRVAKYQRATRSGPAVPIYSVTPGPNAKRPRPYTDAEKAKRWKQRTGYCRAKADAKRMFNQLVRGFA